MNRVPAHHLADTGRCGSCKAPLGPLDEPLDVGAAELDEIVRLAKVPVLVDFWAAWCGPCRAAAPHVEKVAGEKRGKALVLKVDVDKNQELSGRLGIRGIPHFMVFRDGKPVVSQPGLVDARTLGEWLDRAA